MEYITISTSKETSKYNIFQKTPSKNESIFKRTEQIQAGSTSSSQHQRTEPTVVHTEDNSVSVCIEQLLVAVYNFPVYGRMEQFSR